MNIIDFRYRLADLEIEPKEVAFPMGYNEEDTPQEILDMIQKELDQFVAVDDICGAYQVFDAHHLLDEGKLRLADKTFSINYKVAHFLENSEQIIVYISTAGKVISERGKELMDRGDVMEGFIVDTIGTVVVEKLMDVEQKKLKEDYLKKGQHISNRYSPGYADWCVEEQHLLFSLFPKEYCGISLTENSLMMPIKSVSGFMGVGENVKFFPYTCDHCTQQECIYSKRKRTQKSDGNVPCSMSR